MTLVRLYMCDFLISLQNLSSLNTIGLGWKYFVDKELVLASVIYGVPNLYLFRQLRADDHTFHPSKVTIVTYFLFTEGTSILRYFLVSFKKTNKTKPLYICFCVECHLKVLLVWGTILFCSSILLYVSVIWWETGYFIFSCRYCEGLLYCLSNVLWRIPMLPLREAFT